VICINEATRVVPEDAVTADRPRAIARRELLLSAVAAIALHGRLAAQSARSYLPVRVRTLNHVSFGCADLARTVAWFEKVLGIPRHAFQDYGSGQTVLRAGIDPPAYMALSQRRPESLSAPPTRLPHFCWGIDDFDVQRVFAALAEMRIPAESVLREGTTINGVNFDGPDGAPLQFNPVNACGGVGFLGELCDRAAEPRRRPGDPPPIQVRTMNHIKYMVSDLDSALEWYLKLTDMRLVGYQERAEGPRTPGYDGPPIAVLRIGSGPQHLALVEGAGPEAFRMHVGFGVEDFDADAVMSRLAEHGVTARIRMREGITPEVLVDGPDDVRIQLQDVSYCGGGGALGDVCRG
jgi:catechol 2,3-dioxygenase-like lactoylglutathione lyase family enzyme